MDAWIKGDAVESYSAGSEARALDLLAVKVMAEEGVDSSGYRFGLKGERLNCWNFPRGPHLL